MLTRRIFSSLNGRRRPTSDHRTSRTSHRRLLTETLEPRQMLTAAPIISEFMASNGGSHLDGDGNSSNWIELFNAGDETADLMGWYLTDDAANPTA